MCGFAGVVGNFVERKDLYIESDNLNHRGPDEKSSYINDNVHIYKGGSWSDREYWLNPGNRRYLNSFLSANNIGFRCVLDRMGSSVIMNNRAKRKRKQFTRKTSR